MRTTSMMLTSLASAVLIGPAAEACAIHTYADTRDADLPALATVSREDAEKTALDKFRQSTPHSVLSEGLESEDGCLVWSIALRSSGESTVREVLVDAGDGRILAVNRKSPFVVLQMW
jgi:uncharacterized membrane protein YkoI